MQPDDDLTQWISGLARGDESAVHKTWEHCSQRLLQLARRKLGGASRRTADEEDVALSAFDSFCRGAAAGKFPQLDDRQDLWRLLMTITARKATAQIRREYAQRRGKGAVRGESGFLAADTSELDAGIGQVPGREPTPDWYASMDEACKRLLDLLSDKTLRKITLYKLEGYSNQETAQELGCTVRTVERKLARIRDKWKREGDP